MTIKQNWDDSKLTDYLLFDYWHAYSAMWVLAGFNYPSIESQDIEYYIQHFDRFSNPKWEDILNLRAYEHSTTEQKLIEFKRLRANFDRLSDFLQKSQKGFSEEDEVDKFYSPTYFIEWALSKKIRPDWLDWAIEHELFKPRPVTELTTQPSTLPAFDKTSPTYPPELDWAFQAWQAISTTKGKGKPKARTHDWLDEHAHHLSKEAKERIATVVNWDKLGGATRSD